MSFASRLPRPVRRTAVRLTRGAVRLSGMKGRSELSFWTDHWDRQIRDGALWGERTLELSGDAEVADDYLGRRWQQARAEVARVLEEAGIEDRDFFADREVLDIGPGCVGLPDALALEARRSFGLDPIADDYRAAGLLLESDAVYLNAPAERIPLLTGSIDVVICRNALDHVDRPKEVVSEIVRVLRPGGTLILNVDLDHPASPTEPHEISKSMLHEWISALEIEHEREWDHGHAGRDQPGHAIVIVARLPEAAR